MPRISIDNYDTVASWNGSQDLFVVEQPDGTKVATPAMVKQFIEAGDFEATGEVIDGHGNILKDMAKSADVDAEIGDLSQTGLSGDSVAEQLVAAKGQIANKVKLLAEQKTTYTCSSTNFEYTGASVTCPSGHTYIVRARVKYNNCQPIGIIVSLSNTTPSNPFERFVSEDYGSTIVSFTVLAGETAYIWGRWAIANRSNDVLINIVDITN